MNRGLALWQNDVIGKLHAATCLNNKASRMNPLLLLFVRFLNGERLRKPTPEEERLWVGQLFLFAVYFGLAFVSFRYARHFWDTAGQYTLTAVFAIIAPVMFFAPKIWGRYVPAKVSWVLSAVAWPLLFLLALTGHLL